jgi:uncharacterized protein (DUF2141 family)
MFARFPINLPMIDFVKNSCVLCLMLLFAACANHVTPTGGPKDATPPAVIKSNPPDSSLRFNDNRLSFTFNEYIELKDGGTGILFSPPLNKPVSAILRGKTLELKLDEELDSNTTYTLTIGKSVVDLSEGNPYPEKGFVFSTGSILDSLELSGKVQDALTNQPVKEALLLLYTGMHDSLPVKTLPRYFVRSDASGNFLFKNLKPGAYRIIALVDGNANYMYDLPEEKIGFQNQAVNLTESKQIDNPFRIFVNPSSSIRLLRSNFELPAKLTLKYGSVLDSWSIENSDSTQELNYISNFKSGNDSIQVWFPALLKDSLKLITQARKGERIQIDTLNFDILRTKNLLKFKRKKAPVDTILKIENNLTGGKLQRNESFILKFSRPLIKFDTEKMHIKAGNTEFPIDIKNKQADSGIQTLAFGLPVATAEKYSFEAFPGAFTDVFGNTNDTLNTEIGLYTDDELGSLAITLVSDDSLNVPLLIELLSKEGKPIKFSDCQLNKELLFSGLLPGAYRLRLIRDENNNGKWDTGSFEKKIQAEQYEYYAAELVIRAGWDLEQRWELSFKNK